MSRWCLGLFASGKSRYGVCIGWACALWLQRLFLFYVDSKGDVKEFFGLRFGRFSARVQMVFGSFCICSVYMVFA